MPDAGPYRVVECAGPRGKAYYTTGNGMSLDLCDSRTTAESYAQVMNAAHEMAIMRSEKVVAASRRMLTYHYDGSPAWTKSDKNEERLAKALRDYDRSANG